jgi:hypothetical protein
MKLTKIKYFYLKPSENREIIENYKCILSVALFPVGNGQIFFYLLGINVLINFKKKIKKEKYINIIKF